MICPMKFNVDGRLTPDSKEVLLPCEKENCAWWDKQGNQCVLLSLADILATEK